MIYGGALYAEGIYDTEADSAIVLAVASLSQAQAFTSPSLTQASSLTVSSLAQTQSLSDFALTQASSLTVNGLAQTQALASPQLSALQYSRPSSDVAAGAWSASSGSDLYAMIDEALAPNYTDYIWTDSTASVCEVGLSGIPDPGTAVDHVIRYSAKGNGSTGLVVRLREGTTTIATWTETNVPITDTDYEHTLSEAQANSITNYSQLSLQFEAA